MSIISQAYAKIASGASTVGTIAVGALEKGCAPLGGRVISILSSYGVRLPQTAKAIGFISTPGLVGVATVVTAVLLATLSAYAAKRLNDAADVSIAKSIADPNAKTTYTTAVLAKKAAALMLVVASVASVGLVGASIYRSAR